MTYTPEQLRDLADIADGQGIMADGDIYRAHADALEEIERLAARVAELEPNAERYQELLYAVASKWPNESRHETALRYINRFEKNLGDLSGGQSDAARSK